MMTQPSLARLLEGIGTQLADVVAPAVTDQGAATTLQFAIAILADAARRARFETEWLSREIAEIDTAVTPVAAGADAPPALRDAYQGFRTLEHTPDATLTARYEAASNMLSAAIDHAFDTRDTGLIEALERVIGTRLSHESAVLGGPFDWVGRT